MLRDAGAGRGPATVGVEPRPVQGQAASSELRGAPWAGLASPRAGVCMCSGPRCAPPHSWSRQPWLCTGWHHSLQPQQSPHGAGSSLTCDLTWRGRVCASGQNPPPGWRRREQEEGWPGPGPQEPAGGRMRRARRLLRLPRPVALGGEGGHERWQAACSCPSERGIT